MPNRRHDTYPRSLIRRSSRLLLVIATITVSSYCSGPDNQINNTELSADEAYLATTYARIVEAREEYSVNDFKSESLFTFLDTTVDTTRIADTIRALNKDPDRWLLVFQRIEENLKDSSERQGSEETR
jgi:hypothetical protein